MFAALGFTEEEAWNKFGFLLEAFKYGTPPPMEALLMALIG